MRRATQCCGCGCCRRQRRWTQAVDHADSRLHLSVRRVARVGRAPSNAVVAMEPANEVPGQCCLLCALLTTYVPDDWERVDGCVQGARCWRSAVVYCSA